MTKTDPITDPASIPTDEPSSPTMPGAQFARLTVLEDYVRGDDKQMVLCQCSCGSPPIAVQRSALLRGATKSCGCLRRERAKVIIA